VHHGTAEHQMSIEQMELALTSRGEAPRGQRSGEAGPTAQGDARSGDDDLMSRVVERSNLARALKRVRQNNGSAGIDGMTVDELVPYLREHWGRIREELLTGRYQPSAVRQHEIPKGGGRGRTDGDRRQRQERSEGRDQGPAHAPALAVTTYAIRSS